jgi:hypothetical protein
MDLRLQRIALISLVLIVAMAALVYHLSAQRPEAPELVVTTPTSDTVPVASRTTSVALYAYDARLDTDASGNVLCSAKGLVAVDRLIPETGAPLRAAIELLLRDPLTSDERARGLSTEFPLDGVRLDDVAVSGDTATIELADREHKLSGGSCRVSVMRAQLEATATQFKDITDVRFRPEGVLEP